MRRNTTPGITSQYNLADTIASLLEVERDLSALRQLVLVQGRTIDKLFEGQFELFEALRALREELSRLPSWPR